MPPACMLDAASRGWSRTVPGCSCGRPGKEEPHGPRRNPQHLWLKPLMWQVMGEAITRQTLRKAHIPQQAVACIEVSSSSFSLSLSAEGSIGWDNTETSAYVLLSLLFHPEVSPDDLSYSSQIVRSLAKEQNPYGGFSSTQVTGQLFPIEGGDVWGWGWMGCNQKPELVWLAPGGRNRRR